MADTPQFLTLAGNRDRSERVELAFRRSFFSLILLVLIAALLNVFAVLESGGRISFIPKSR